MVRRQFHWNCLAMCPLLEIYEHPAAIRPRHSPWPWYNKHLMFSMCQCWHCILWQIALKKLLYASISRLELIHTTCCQSNCNFQCQWENSLQMVRDFLPQGVSPFLLLVGRLLFYELSAELFQTTIFHFSAEPLRHMYSAFHWETKVSTIKNLAAGNE